MSALLILNDPPYGTERSYNALRLAGALAKRPQYPVRVFLLADAVGCARTGQQVPAGFYHLGRMLQAVLQHGGEVAVCGSCMDARGLTESDLIAGARRSSLDELADWTAQADRVLVF
jgi:uncharacterized protein involved in oxidation of intracellular sulfur